MQHRPQFLIGHAGGDHLFLAGQVNFPGCRGGNINVEIALFVRAFNVGRCQGQFDLLVVGIHREGSVLGINVFAKTVGIFGVGQAVDVQVVQLVLFFFLDENPHVGELGNDDARLDQRLRIAFHRFVNNVVHARSGPRHDFDIHPCTQGRQQRAEKEDRTGDAKQADSAEFHGIDFLLGGKPAEHQQHGGHESPGDRVHQRNREGIQNEFAHQGKRHMLVDHQRSDVLKDSCQHQKQTQ